MKLIIHVALQSEWDRFKNLSHYETSTLETEGFIHCSDVHYFWRVAPIFKSVSEPLVVLVLDESLIDSVVKYESIETEGRAYPHIYGKLNTDSVIKVLPYFKDDEGNWIKNSEFSDIENQ